MEKNNLKSTVAIIVAIIAVGCAAASFFFNKQENNQAGVNTNTIKNQAITVACVDTDTLFAKYDMVADVTNEIAKTEKKINADYTSRAQKLASDFDNYVNKTGASMTLSEQKKKEEQLTNAKKSLEELEKKYSEQLIKMKIDKNNEITNNIFSFIEQYNKENGNYTFIISKSRTSGVLYSPENVDITKEVVEAINKAYHNRSK